MTAGLVGGEGFAVDASVIEANASRFQRVEGFEVDWTDEQRASRPVQEYLVALESENPPINPRQQPKAMSPSDPCAAWTTRGRHKVMFGYSLNYLIDMEHSVILDVEATPTRISKEVDATETMLERTEERFALKPQRLAGDVAYGTGERLRWLVDHVIDPCRNASSSQTNNAKPPQQHAKAETKNIRDFYPIRLRALADTEELDSALLANLPRLPDTADEVRSIALAMNADLTRDVFVGKDANEEVVKTLDLSGYRVLAFATHGLVPGDLNGLRQPALAMTSPHIAGVKGDGLLTMGEILGLRLDADWVVLSACNTAAGAGKGAEAISGLGRAFMYAGARSLLVSNWPVETTSAKELTTDIFRRQAADPGLERAEALREAMAALIDGLGYLDDEGRAVFSYAHPIFWAPFTLARIRHEGF